MGGCIDFNVFISFPLFSMTKVLLNIQELLYLIFFPGSSEKTHEVGKIRLFKCMQLFIFVPLREKSCWTKTKKKEQFVLLEIRWFYSNNFFTH